MKTEILVKEGNANKEYTFEDVQRVGFTFNLLSVSTGEKGRVNNEACGQRAFNFKVSEIICIETKNY